MKRQSKWAVACAVGLMGVGMSGMRGLGAPPIGPPWPVNYPLDKVRAASEAPKEDYIFASRCLNGSPLAVEIAVGGAVAKPTAGGLYTIYYQVYVRTPKGEVLLGDKDFPDGVNEWVRDVTANDDWLEYYEKFDLTRKDLNAMKGMPEDPNHGADRDMVLRVCGAIKNQATKTYVTPKDPPSVYLVASVSQNGHVYRLWPISEWLLIKSRDDEDAKKAVEVLKGLNIANTMDNAIDTAVEGVLNDKEASSASKALYLGALPAEALGSKSNYNLKTLVEKMAAGEDAVLKEAAGKKLAEMKGR